MTRKKTIALASILRDAALQMRDVIDVEVIERYADEYRAEQPHLRSTALGPVRCVTDGEVVWLVDGWHRVAAAESAGMTEIACVLEDGDYNDAREKQSTLDFLAQAERSVTTPAAPATSVSSWL